MTGQDFVVFFIVACAAAYLVRHFVVSSQSGGSCGKCSGGGCATKTKKVEPQLVQIDLGGSWKRD